jgi:hypothetical protein
MTALGCGWCTDTSEHIRCPEHGPDAPYVPTVALMPETLEPIRLRLPFVKPPITANEARHDAHWGGQAREKKVVAQAVMAVVRQARVPALERVAIELTWFAPDYGIRDPDGLAYPMGKAVIDALTPPRAAIPKGAPTKAGGRRKTALPAKIGAGIIPGDDARYVESVLYRIILADPDPRIELLLRPLPGMPPPPARKARRRSAVTSRRGTVRSSVTPLVP